MVSIVWKDIMQIKSKNPEVFSKYSENISISIGNGLSTQFWIDPWVHDACLCRLYPRIFNVISNKDESVAEVFQRKEELFFWSFQQRRNLFVWEDEEMQDLRNFLDGLHISIQMRPDHIIWMACNSKSYSVSSMYNLSLIPASTSEINDSKSSNWIWKSAAPYRVQCFIWMVNLGKLKTGKFLLNIGIIQQPIHALCKFCGDEIESIDHSLLLCPVVWNVWCLILQWWGLKWVTPQSVINLFSWWNNFKFKPKVNWIWKCIPYAVLWSLWKMRNEHLFQDKSLLWEDIVDLIKLRVAFWVKSNGDFDGYSVNDFLYRLNSILEAVG